MLRLALAVVVVASSAASGCTCGGCWPQGFDYYLSDAQIAEVTEGTSAPTVHGCDVVCRGQRAAVERIPPDGAAGSPAPLSCSLTRDRLTCVFQVCAY